MSEAATPRVPPLAADEWGDAEYRAFGALLGAPGDRVPRAGSGHRYDPLNFAVVGTMVRHPALAEAFLSFNRFQLQQGELPARFRELAILRVSLLRCSQYEWGQHVKVALECGITDEEIERIPEGAARFEGDDATVLAATDELLADGRLGDERWQQLRSFLDEHQAFELLFAVGTYSLLAMVFETWALAPEPGMPPLPSVS